jgi:hypothetical protein
MPHIILASQVLSKNATAGFGQGFLERVSAAQPLPLLLAQSHQPITAHEPRLIKAQNGPIFTRKFIQPAYNPKASYLPIPQKFTFHKCFTISEL